MKPRGAPPMARKTTTKPAATGESGAPSAPRVEPPHICVDRVVPPEYSPERAQAERAVLELAGPSAGRGNALSMSASGVIPRLEAAIVNLKKWPNGTALRCKFLDGGPAQRKKVQAKAALWEQYANIRFKFVAAGDAEIRISFAADPGSWSAVGTDALIRSYFPKYQPTMNYGWLRADTDDEECERVVLHEFGHALGLIHEHQSPRASLRWDTAAVYRAFSGPPNFWSKDQIDFNVLQKYDPAGITASRFDDKSIMLYQFDGSLFLDRKPTPTNFQLSARDKKFIASMYPKA